MSYMKTAYTLAMEIAKKKNNNFPKWKEVR